MSHMPNTLLYSGKQASNKKKKLLNYLNQGKTLSNSYVVAEDGHLHELVSEKTYELLKTKSKSKIIELRLSKSVKHPYKYLVSIDTFKSALNWGKGIAETTENHDFAQYDTIPGFLLKEFGAYLEDFSVA